MGPPSSFFLAIVAIIILSFAILGFISAVNYKNVANNDTEGESIGKGTANSLSTVMIIFGIVMIVIFIWFVYVVFTYDSDKSPIDKRDVSLLVKAKESISKLQSVKDSYVKLKSNFEKLKEKKTEDLKKYTQWDYCPSPRIKLNIKKDTGEVLQPVYGKDGKIESLIIKPAKTNPNDTTGCSGYKKLDFEVETQPCYELNENKDKDKDKNKPGFFTQKFGPLMSQTLGPMSQTMPIMGIPGIANQNVFSPFQMGKKEETSSKECGSGFLTRKTVEVPGISFSKKCAASKDETEKEPKSLYPPGLFAFPGNVQPPTMGPPLIKDM
jgi:hypothetical protein